MMQFKLSINDAQGMSHQRGFSLVEIAVVLVIIAILITAVGIPIATQAEQQRVADTQKQLDVISEAIYGFAMANGRLPCPSRYVSDADNSAGRESFCTAATGTCVGTETTAVQAHGNCSNHIGFLPATTLGLKPTDNLGFSIDAFGLSQNRIRYAVFGSPTVNAIFQINGVDNAFTKTDGLRTATMSMASASTQNYLFVCGSAATGSPLPSTTNTTALSTNTCGVGVTTLTNQAPFIIWSLGKNAPTGGAGADEATNLNGDFAFAFHTQTASGASGGEFDDIVTWGNLNTLFARMVQAGKLP
jgi:prepilin-type N-terminal cleavage/methylation domain-containing protein